MINRQEMAALCIATYNQRGWLYFAGPDVMIRGENLLATAAELLDLHYDVMGERHCEVLA